MEVIFQVIIKPEPQGPSNADHPKFKQELVVWNSVKGLLKSKYAISQQIPASSDEYALE